jgi:hypothetical protein
VNVAAVPLKATLVEPFRLFPRRVTAVPTLPEVGRILTNALRPSDRLKTVPSPLARQSTLSRRSSHWWLEPALASS